MSGETPLRVALVVHPHRKEASELSERARRWWKARGYEVVEYGELDSPPDATLPAGGVRFAVSLGGDGTMLRTVQLVVDHRVPILGVNLGHLGYLTPVEPASMEAAFEHLVAGSYEVEERSTLELFVGRSADVPGEVAEAATAPRLRRFVGLNEASIEKTMPGHTIRFSLEIGGRPFLTYAADGVLAATPTGSTAYNLSLRGPVLSPVLRSLVVTPIAPHMLFDRALVLGPTEPVRVHLLEERAALLVVDGGHAEQLAVGDAVLIAVGPTPVCIVGLTRHHFHEVLRHKFNLTDR